MMYSRVFVSYSHLDFPFVETLVAFLENTGIETWFDKKDLLAGQKWENVIQTEIRNAGIFLICLSRKGLDRRGFFNKELRLGLDVALTIPPKDLFIMPVRLDDCDIPDDLRQYHIIGLSDKEGPERLVKSLSFALKKEYRIIEEQCDQLRHALLNHLGIEDTNIDELVNALLQGMRSPEDNVGLIEKIANSQTQRRLEVLTKLRGNDSLSFAETKALDLAIDAVRQSKRVKNLFDIVTKEEKEKILRMGVMSGDPVKTFALRQLKYWRYINRKSHPQYTEVEEQIMKHLVS